MDRDTGNRSLKICHAQNRMPPMTSSISSCLGNRANALGKQSVDWLRTACYFMTRQPGRKSSASGITSPFWRRQKTRRIFSRDFLTFRQKNWRAFVMLSALCFSAKLRPPPEAKSYRMHESWRRWAPLVWRGLRGSGALGVALFDADGDPADRRLCNDKQFAPRPFSNQTAETAADDADRNARPAQRNADFSASYMAKLSAELKGDYETRDEAVIQMLAAYVSVTPAAET